MGKKSESHEVDAEAEAEAQAPTEAQAEEELDLFEKEQFELVLDPAVVGQPESNQKSVDDEEGAIEDVYNKDWNGGRKRDANLGGGNGMSDSVLDVDEDDLKIVEEEELEEEVVPDDFIPLWKPSEPGESLVGTVVTKFDSVYGLALAVKTRSGSVYQTPAHQSLIKRIEKIQPGDTIRILYEGKVRTAKGFIAASYRVFRADRKQKRIEDAKAEAEAEAEALSQAEVPGENARDV